MVQQRVLPHGHCTYAPATVHYGKAQEVYRRDSERFVRGMPRVPMSSSEAWINKPDDPEAARKTAARRKNRRNPNPKRERNRCA